MSNKVKKQPAISRRSAKLVVDFDRAAQRWGYEADQGFRLVEVDEVKRLYELRRDALIRRIARLEAKK